MVLSDLSRSSKKQAAASKKQKQLVTEQLKESEGDELQVGLDVHRKMLCEIYGAAIGAGWAPHEITLDWLVPELQSKLGTWYDDDYFRIVYDGEFRPGMAAAAQQQYTATVPTREIMKEAWPVPETAAPIDPEMANQVLSTIRKEHVRFTDDDSDDDSETVRTLFAGNQSGDGVDLDDIDDVASTTGKRKWKKAITTTDEDVVDWKQCM